MATAYPALIKYDQSTQSNYVVRSLKSNFGDGFQEVTPDGINNIVQAGQLKHVLLPLADNAQTIGSATLRTFLKANAGSSNVITIKNIMEDPTGSTTLNVYLESWSETFVGTHITFSVSFREAFNA